MLNRLYKPIATAAIAGLAIVAVAAAPLQAQDVSGKDVKAIVQPTGDWLEILPNELDWYQVNYDFTQDDDDETTSSVTVELEMGTEDSVGFNVYTPDQIAAWQDGDEVDPMGAGSLAPGQSEDLPQTKLTWTSSGGEDQTFYIVVGNKVSDAASYYDIEISGSGLSYPVGTSPDPAAAEEAEADADAEEIEAEAATEADADAEVATETDAAAESEADAEATADVEMMDTAQGQLYGIGTPTGEWMTLGPRQGDWYQIDYKFLEIDDETVSEAYVELDMDVCGSLTFDVYTPNEVQEWVDGETPDPIGSGTPFADSSDEDSDEDSSDVPDQSLCKLSWDNKTTASETFYIVVNNQSNGPSDYLLTITGNGVSFPMGTHEVQTASAEPAAVDAADADAADADAADADAAAAVDEDAPTAVLVPTGEWEELSPRHKDWYQVNYHFIETDDEAVSDLYVQLDMGEQDTVDFDVYTPDELAQWQNGEEYDPIGSGTPPESWDEDLPETRLTWDNTAHADQLFYIVVTNVVDVPSHYELTISGNGISFPMGAME